MNFTDQLRCIHGRACPPGRVSLLQPSSNDTGRFDPARRLRRLFGVITNHQSLLTDHSGVRELDAGVASVAPWVLD